MQPAGYNWRQQRRTFLYSEITGYAISTYLRLYTWTGDSKYERLAREAGDALLRLQCWKADVPESGAVPHSLRTPDLRFDERYFSFDNAMILQGLPASLRGK